MENRSQTRIINSTLLSLACFFGSCETTHPVLPVVLGDGAMYDFGVDRVPQYEIRFPPISVSHSGLYRYVCTGMPKLEMNIELQIRNSLASEVGTRTQSRVFVRLSDSSGKVYEEDGGSLGTYSDHPNWKEWIPKGNPAYATFYYPGGPIFLQYSPLTHYILEIKVETPDRAGVAIEDYIMTPAIVGGGRKAISG